MGIVLRDTQALKPILQPEVPEVPRQGRIGAVL